MTIGQRIGQLRRKKNMTQEALAKELGVTNQAVSKWESDQSCPDISLLPAIGDLFDVTLDTLFDRPSHSAKAEENPEGGRNGTHPLLEPSGMPKGFDLEETGISVQDVPWEDDGAWRIVVYRGRRLMEECRPMPEVTVVLKGSVGNVDCMLNLRCEDVQGNVSAGDGVTCGNVAGSVNAGDSVTCGNVGGDVDAGDNVRFSGAIDGSVHAGDSVNAGCIQGNVDAGGNVACGNVDGGVDAGGNVACGNVDGDVDAGGDVYCGAVGGSVQAAGDICCGSVEGSVEAGGDVKCTEIGGNANAGGNVRIIRQ